MNPIKYVILFFLSIVFFSSPAAGTENIGALGKIFPRDGIVSLMGTPGDVISRVHVSTGDLVENGDLLVSFASRERLEKEVTLSKSEMDRIAAESALAIQIQEKRLTALQIRSNSLIALQKAQIKTARKKLAFARGNLERLLSAGSDSFSAQQKEAREHEEALSEIHLDTAMEELKRLESDRDADLELGRLELNRLIISRDHQLARAGEALDAARKKFENADLKAPGKGIILDIMMKKGETAGSTPIIRLADLSAMTVIAEVFQTDLLTVARGMRAAITSKSIPTSISGKVADIGRVIQDPSRVAKVVIVLDDPALASRLINLEVEVSIMTGE